jgi:nucleotide-binding universal stress UspA family protein
VRILLAVDGSNYSDVAIGEVARRPWPPKSEVKVITAAETPAVPGIEAWAASATYLEEMEKAVREQAQGVIDAALQKLKTSEDKTLKLSSDIISGSPSQVIVEAADAWTADLIVIGSRGLGGWNRLLLGSVSDSVVHHAKCSVEIVRKPSPEGSEKN